VLTPDAHSQDQKDECTNEELATLDSAIAAFREAIPLLKAELKSKSTFLATLQEAPTTEALQEAVEGLESKKAAMEARLQVLRSGNVKPVSQEERERAEVEFKKWARKAAIRKKCWKEAEAALLEGLTREELYVSENLFLNVEVFRIRGFRRRGIEETEIWDAHIAGK
jgi:hypothetical protein